jgi:hypothetical protein
LLAIGNKKEENVDSRHLTTGSSGLALQTRSQLNRMLAAKLVGGNADAQGRNVPFQEGGKVILAPAQADGVGGREEAFGVAAAQPEPLPVVWRKMATIKYTTLYNGS